VVEFAEISTRECHGATVNGRNGNGDGNGNRTGKVKMDAPLKKCTPSLRLKCTFIKKLS